MDNKWNLESFGNFNNIQHQNLQNLHQQQQQQHCRSLDDGGPPAKRTKIETESESGSDGEDEENYSPSSSPNPVDTTNPYNGPGPLAHSTPIIPLPSMDQQQQQMQQFQNFMNPMAAAAMDPLMQQQWAAQYQMLQQQQHHQQLPPQGPGYPPMYANMFNLNNTHTSGSSDDDSGNSSSMLTANNLDKPSNEVTFCHVPGRLALLSSNKKVKVSLAEIKRRINAPECLNSSLLSAILRKAKNKEGGKQLAEELSKYNIKLPTGRRKTAPNTAFTALVEGEAVTLARDFGELSKNHFPTNSIVYEFLKGITSSEDRLSKYGIVTHMMQVVGPLASILACDTSPFCDRPLNLQSPLHPDSQKDFTKFSLLTHGFGSLALHSSWSTLLNCVKVLQNALIDPKTFCTQLQRPIPLPLAAIIETETMQQQQIQQQQQMQQQQPQFPQPQQYPHGYPSMTQPPQPQPQQQMPKENPNGYLQLM